MFVGLRDYVCGLLQIGGLLGGRGGRVRAYRHPVPSPPGSFPLDTCRIEAWTPHWLTPPDPGVTLWDIMTFQGVVLDHGSMRDESQS